MSKPHIVKQGGIWLAFSNAANTKYGMFCSLARAFNMRDLFDCLAKYHDPR